jgi:hypothetical protein
MDKVELRLPRRIREIMAHVTLFLRFLGEAFFGDRKGQIPDKDIHGPLLHGWSCLLGSATAWR